MKRGSLHKGRFRRAHLVNTALFNNSKLNRKNCFSLPSIKCSAGLLSLRQAILFFFGSSEVNSTRLIPSKLANQHAQRVLFTCVVYTNYKCKVDVLVLEGNKTGEFSQFSLHQVTNGTLD